MARNVSENGIALIKHLEGFREYAYEDPIKPGLWTVGYGSTGDGIHEGVIVTMAYGDQLLRAHIAKLEVGLGRYVQTFLGQNQLDAVISLAYNVGLGAFRRSHLLARMNACEVNAPVEFLDWDHDEHGNEVSGLKTRRQIEYRLFLRDPWPPRPFAVAA